jgi:hypothetical protein
MAHLFGALVALLLALCSQLWPPHICSAAPCWESPSARCHAHPPRCAHVDATYAGAPHRRAAVGGGGTSPRFAQHANLDLARFGEHSFKGEVASRFLGKYGESATLLTTPTWTAHKADVVAAAILDWARDNGASCFTHWFQPMGASGFRHGQTGQVYNTMLEFDANNVPRWKARLRLALLRAACAMMTMHRGASVAPRHLHR